MADEVKKEPVEEESSTMLPAIDTSSLNKESYDIINQVIHETDVEKVRDLTNLFNLNQNKKTMARVNKLNELLDVITDQAILRFSNKPDNISNQELLQGLKVVQDMMERGQNQVSGVNDKPLIQINQQNNEVNVGGAPENMSKDSRERISKAVLGILGALNTQQDTEQAEADIVVEEADIDEH